MSTFKIRTLGCKVNQSESDVIAKELKAIDWLPAGNGDASEVLIINTCTVTQKAAMQSRQAVRQAIRAHPDARIVVTGCYAQTEPTALETISGVDYIIGNADKHRITEILAAEQTDATHQTVTICNDIRQLQQLNPSLAAISENRNRPFFKIQDGCNAACSYCIVPHARGPSRSLPPGDVLDGAVALFEAGFHEMVLSGIHQGLYGRDLTPETSLSALLDSIERLSLNQRVRLSSIEPLELTDDLIQRVAETPRFCRHFHIPLQSGDDRILNKMKRPYTSESFRQRVLSIHNRLPDAAIGVDILIGFPGETDAAFTHTYDLIGELPITYLHVFPFSARPGTPAAHYPGKVPPEVIKKRCKQMRRLGSIKRQHFNQRFIGKELEVLVESARHAATGLLKGLSSNYIPVLIDAAASQINKCQPVRITAQVDHALKGIIVNI